MVREGVVLLRVEHVQQRRRRVTAKVHADLVDLIEHKDRIHTCGALHRLEDAAGKGAHISAAMATDLGLIANATQTDADKVAAECRSNRLAE